MIPASPDNGLPAPSTTDDAFIARWVERLQSTIPGAAAVILKGSHARSDAGPYSDLDFDLLTAGEAREEYPAYLDEIAGRLIHVSVAIRDLPGWLAEEAEPAGWAFGLPASEAMRLLWVADDTFAKALDRAARHFPAGEPELEDFVAGLGKVRQSHAQDDDLALRLAAQDLARLCPSVLRPLNPEVRVGTRREALLAALAFPVSPPGYPEDMRICLGLTGHATTADDVHAAAGRLVIDVLETIRPHAAQLAPLLPPDLAAALASGALQRYAAQ
jgi:phosphoribosyl-AMP cyclohydrolase